ncbi:hypothetical protein [Streptomyces sp. Isolate_45]|uniref:hypothetical protein n=1 Tax=Streptomyces sp. Isolate_45 TaxID=2950111 RepID=UPI0024820316|nr:hypothetical protein [Streptomyces sp. Isolate_45]MDA5281082.1 hypothetical protein [Streptomyces sp. Isolate_45]
MATLNLNTLRCIDTTSGPGADDVYIRVDGDMIYPTTTYPSYKEFDPGDSAELNRSISFTNMAKVTIRDYDTADPDDLIGSFWVHDSQAGTGEHAESLNGDGSDYDLFYDVTNP